ncbi:MAG: carbohydrate ABC transporter permease [Muricomes sp.]|uniref:carbohydrate ABC transporter permease n=1 Tax=Faecalicatena contorta TaxID=39482 RepID=UPI002EC2851E|nr:carbohydrate ABC transporter permease [Muricomes sp.]
MKKRKRKWILGTGMTLLSVVFLYPLLWMVLTSLKTKEDVMLNPFGLPTEWMFSNYVDAFKAFDFPRFFLNSVIYTAGTIVLTVFCAVLFSYAVARMRFKLNNFLVILLQVGMVVPVFVIVLSLFKMMGDLGIRNTYQGMIMLYTASALPISVIIFAGYFRSLPFELEEAAYIDGCGVFKTFFKIMVPMVAPAITTVVIVVFMNYSWNEFSLAYLLIDAQEMRSLPISLNYFTSLRGTDWGLLGATMVMISIPAVLLNIVCGEKIENALTVTSALK